MRKLTTNLLLAIAVWVLVMFSTAIAGETPARKLIKLAPAVRSGDINCRSIKFAGSLRMDSVRLHILAWYRSPDQYSFQVESGDDARAVLFLSDRKLIIYNPVEDTVVYVNPARFEFSFRIEDGRRIHKFFVSNSEEPSEILVDIKSLFSVPSNGKDDVRAEKGAFRLTRTTVNGSTLTALVDPARRCPYRKFSITGDGETEPEFVVEEISVDEDVSEQLPPFPSRAILQKRVRLTDWSEIAQRVDNDFSALACCFLSARLAVYNMDARREYERLRPKIDWEDVDINDRWTSFAIRELLQSAVDVKKR
jgi:hypothetical protein